MALIKQMARRVASSYREGKVVGNKFYTTSDEKDPIMYPNKVSSLWDLQAYEVRDHDWYTKSYLQNLAQMAQLPYYRYIFKSHMNLRLFDPREKKDWEYALQHDVFDEEMYRELYNKETTPENLKDTWDANVSDIRSLPKKFPKFTDTEKFNTVFDGFYGTSNYNKIRVWKRHVEKFELFDGNIQRFVPEKKGDPIEVPKEVFEELDYYTKLHSRSMDQEAIEWLQENFPLSYTSKTLYRGFGLGWEDFKSTRAEDLTVDLIEKRIKSTLGLNDVGDLKVSQPVKARRYKESSWSTDPRIAIGFASGYVNFLIKAEVPAEDIIIDFTEMPTDQRRKFEHWSQNEIIVRRKSIPSTINSIWFREDMEKRLYELGYGVNQNGVYKLIP